MATNAGKHVAGVDFRQVHSRLTEEGVPQVPRRIQTKM